MYGREKPLDSVPEISLVGGDVSVRHRKYIHDRIQDSVGTISRALRSLPPMDSTIARLYYLDELGQCQIATLLGMSQAAVSRRLKYLFPRIRFFLESPSEDPVEIRRDLRFLFEDDLFEAAYFLYWDWFQNRVKYLLQSSQSGVAAQFKKILQRLENLAKEYDPQDPEERHRQYLARIYLEWFTKINKRSGTSAYGSKKNDAWRC